MPNVSVLDQSVFAFDDFSPYLYCQALATYLFFPAMPESYEIARENDFDTGDKIPLFPDGLIAIYKGCDPIHIPISFSVHSNDPRCINGPITLMDAAKALHAMALPSIPDNAISSLSLSSAINQNGSEASQSSAGQSAFSQDGLGNVTPTSPISAASAVYYMPPMVQLVMFEATADGTATYVTSGTGVNMKGFLKSVKVTPRGPWLKAEGFTGRLPSSMDYSFTFVFFPSYTPTPTAQYSATTTTGLRVAQYFFGSQATVPIASVPPATFAAP